MDHFVYRDGELFCENAPVQGIAATEGTPLYVYSKATLLHHYLQIKDAFSPVSATVCYSIKSCGNVNICRLLAQQGCGFDVTSGGELYRALRAGGDPSRIIFAGVGKTDAEICAALDANIAAFNIESEQELLNIERIAKSLQKTAVAALRINPDVDPGTHRHTTTGTRQTKFGVDIDVAADVFDRARDLKHVRLAGVHMHIGSPVYRVEPYVTAVGRLNELIDTLRARGQAIEWFDLGGGFGVNYEHPTQALPVAEFAAALLPLLRGRGYRVAVEPGRYIAANAGILVTQVLYRKSSGEKRFVIVDAGMNDLIRPVLYDSFHYIWPVRPDAANAAGDRDRSRPVANGETVDVVGPICETGDFLARDRLLPPTARGDLLAVFTAGAYGFAMSSNYNNRPRAAEVLVDGDRWSIIRRRETYDDLIAPERV